MAKKDRTVRYSNKNLTKQVRGSKLLAGQKAEVGFFNDKRHNGISDKAGAGAFISVGAVASWMNEGTNPRAPQRDFFDIASTLARRDLKNLAQRLKRRYEAGTITREQFSQKMGDELAGWVKEVMLNSESYGIPENSDSWSKIKGGSPATIHTGELLRNLEVRLGIS